MLARLKSMIQISCQIIVWSTFHWISIFVTLIKVMNV